MATLITKNSSTASSIPTAVQLVQGELAVNVTDKRLFTENSAGAVVELGTNPSSITTGTLTATGNVGIGTTNPIAKLDINKGSAGLLANFTDGVNTNFQISTTSLLATVGPAAGSTNLALQTGGVERVRIDSSGNLLVGTTSSIGSSPAKLEIQGGSGGGRPFNARVDLSTSATQISFNNPNGQVGSISTNGSTTAYNTSSDYRLKNTIAPMTGALDKVALLKPVTYKWIADGSDGQGFIAHELAEVEPGCVSGEKDAVDAEGKPQYQGIDTSFLVATLAAAVQELKAIVDEQAVKIAALEAK
jgi:hypothetical protein